MRMRSVTLAAAMVACGLCVGASLARAESVDVKYRGAVNLKSFDCTDTARSSFIRRVCYDKANEYMLINLNGTYYHYCAIDAGSVSHLLTAPSMGTFYIANIKSNFDCRINPVPDYGCSQNRETKTVPSEEGGTRQITITRCGRLD